jgi:hypothetical protein
MSSPGPSCRRAQKPSGPTPISYTSSQSNLSPSSAWSSSSRVILPPGQPRYERLPPCGKTPSRGSPDRSAAPLTLLAGHAGRDPGDRCPGGAARHGGQDGRCGAAARRRGGWAGMPGCRGRGDVDGAAGRMRGGGGSGGGGACHDGDSVSILRRCSGSYFCLHRCFLDANFSGPPVKSIGSETIPDAFSAWLGGA